LSSEDFRVNLDLKRCTIMDFRQRKPSNSGSKAKICPVFTGTQLFNAEQISGLEFQSEVMARDIVFPLNTSVTAWRDVYVQIAERAMSVLDSSGEAAEASFLSLLKETHESTHQAGACSRYRRFRNLFCLIKA